MSKDRIVISIDELRRINSELLQDAIERRNDAAPDRLPRLSKPPAQEAKAA
jgi:hypothetical protein